jgi:hypothetical protein
MLGRSQRKNPVSRTPRWRPSPLVHTAVIACLAVGGAWALAAALGGCGKSAEPDPAAGLPPKEGPAAVDKFADGSTGRSNGNGNASSTWFKPAEAPPASPPRAEELEKALRAGDAQAAAACFHPDYRQAYQAKILSDPATMTRAANLLATRKLVAEHSREAQYEVTEDGKKFPVIFEKTSEGQWFLVAF